MRPQLGRRSSGGLRSQDVMIVLKIARLGPKSWSFDELSSSLTIARGNCHAGYVRLKGAGLVREVGSSVKVANRRLLDFLVYGVPVSFYAQRAEVVRGIPTAGFAPVFSGKLTPDEETAIPMVWPSSDGSVRGESLLPIHEAMPRAAKLDEELYDLFAMVDAVRVGRSKERKAAIEMLTKRFGE